MIARRTDIPVCRAWVSTNICWTITYSYRKQPGVVSSTSQPLRLFGWRKNNGHHSLSSSCDYARYRNMPGGFLWVSKVKKPASRYGTSEGKVSCRRPWLLSVGIRAVFAACEWQGGRVFQADSSFHSLVGHLTLNLSGHCLTGNVE